VIFPLRIGKEVSEKQPEQICCPVTVIYSYAKTGIRTKKEVFIPLMNTS